MSHTIVVSYQIESGNTAQAAAAAMPMRSFQTRVAIRYSRRHIKGAVATLMARIAKAEARLSVPKNLNTNACSAG